MEHSEIISRLPYSEPFLFVDEITQVDIESIEGNFTFRNDLVFYAGHFKDRPVTPGVILIETMAQIGLTAFGIYLLGDTKENRSIALTSVEAEFENSVYPGDKVIVKSIKKYFRFGKLKCYVSMYNSNGLPICSATIAGMIISGNE